MASALRAGNTKSGAQVSAHHGATEENGLEINRYSFLGLERARGGVKVMDGTERMHFFNQRRESEQQNKH